MSFSGRTFQPNDEYYIYQTILQDSLGNIEYPWVVFIIELLDNFVVIFFTIEFAVRLIICPNKNRSSKVISTSSNSPVFRFLKEPMNMIDIVAICPFYISLLLEGLEDFQIIGKTGKIIRLVRTIMTMIMMVK